MTDRDASPTRSDGRLHSPPRDRPSTGRYPTATGTTPKCSMLDAMVLPVPTD